MSKRKQGFYSDAEKEALKNEPCPFCVKAKNYCGGSGHPSCGCFVYGIPATSEEAYNAKYGVPPNISSSRFY